MRNYRPAGQDLVEYALVVPIFLLLMLIIVDFGRVTFFYATLNNVTREGSRFGVIPANHDQTTQVEAEARSHAFALDPANLNIQVTWYHPSTVLIPNHTVRVVATYSFSPILLPSTTFTLRSTSTMHLEY
jgi:Flp pilus assembly protein TadG